MALVKEIEGSTFQIGAVSRLTGVQVDTLRMWERRYGVVEPLRAPGNHRLYARSDIVRLTLIKQLVDRGHAISTVANLAESELRERLNLHAQVEDKTIHSESPCRVVVFGDVLPITLESNLNQARGTDLASIEIIGMYTQRSKLEQGIRSWENRPDVLVLDWPSVHPESLDEIQSLANLCGAKHTIVVYGFASKEAVGRFGRRSIHLLRAPVSAMGLQEACLAFFAGGSGNKEQAEKNGYELTRRIFDNADLASIAAASTTVKCECPHHLVDLVFKLISFETYSAECGNRNEQDAFLHERLHQTTAKARSIIEGALAEVVQSEGIEVPSRSNQL